MNPKESTRRRYLEVWGTHLLPRLGDYQLREITPALVEDLCAHFRAAGVGVQTQRKAVMLLQGILRRAVVRGLIPSNPVSVIDKPRQPPTKRPQPLAPLMVEKIRAGVSLRDATLTSLLAYGGARPDEAKQGGTRGKPMAEEGTDTWQTGGIATSTMTVLPVGYPLRCSPDVRRFS